MELIATNSLLSFCFDCEIIIPEGTALCDTCENHRSDGHLSSRFGDRRHEYCHGWGPTGRIKERSTQYPRDIYWSETVEFEARNKRRE